MMLVLSCKTFEELTAAYLPFIQYGGLFIAQRGEVTNMGEVLELQLTLPNQSVCRVSAQVVWRVPVATAIFDQTGVGVQLLGAAGIELAEKIAQMVTESS